MCPAIILALTMNTISSVSLLQPVPGADDGDDDTQHIDLTAPSAVAVERLFSAMGRSAALLRAIRDFDAAAQDVKRTIRALAGGDARVQLLQDHYLFIAGARLRTFVLRVSGKTSGAVAEVLRFYRIHRMFLTLSSDP